MSQARTKHFHTWMLFCPHNNFRSPDEKTEAQRDRVTCLRSHSRWVGEPEPELSPDPPASQVHRGHHVHWCKVCRTQRCPPRAELAVKSTRVPLTKLSAWPGAVAAWRKRPCFNFHSPKGYYYVICRAWRSALSDVPQKPIHTDTPHCASQGPMTPVVMSALCLSPGPAVWRPRRLPGEDLAAGGPPGALQGSGPHLPAPGSPHHPQHALLG